MIRLTIGESFGPIIFFPGAPPLDHKFFQWLHTSNIHKSLISKLYMKSLKIGGNNKFLLLKISIFSRDQPFRQKSFRVGEKNKRSRGGDLILTTWVKALNVKILYLDFLQNLQMFSFFVFLFTRLNLQFYFVNLLI